MMKKNVSHHGSGRGGRRRGGQWQGGVYNLNVMLFKLLWMMLVVVVDAKTCLLLYMLADNNLEYYINQDYGELTQSSVIGKTEQLRTWVYYDAGEEGIPLPNTVLEDGATAATETYFGSRYVMYDGTIQKMKIMQDINDGVEQNSGSGTTIENFLKTGLADCVANGYTSLMAIFSDHGGGWQGYGSDDNQRRGRRRRLQLQVNSVLVTAMKNALTTVNVDKFDVVGFDACLMQAVGAVDDYRQVAKYFLASQSVTPGAGWAYAFLEDASDALTLAKQIVTTFVEQPQGPTQATPKIMSIVDTTKFDVFVTAFETLFANLYNEVFSNQDQSLISFVGRARSASVDFEGTVDAQGTDNPSVMDIGSFLQNLQDLCSPSTTNPLGQSLSSAISTYNDMFVDLQIGQGTEPGTGMGINWPFQAEYQANKYTWDSVLFNIEQYPDWVTAIDPNYRKFLQEYLQAASPPLTTTTTSATNSVCGTSSDSTTTPDADKTGLIYSTVNVETDTSYTITAEISPHVTHMMPTYGMNVTRALRKELEEHQADYGGIQFTPGTDFLLLANGMLDGTYSASSFTATWNKRYYSLQSTNIQGEAFRILVYVKERSSGSRRSPVLYFPEEFRSNIESLKPLDFLIFDQKKWMDLGATGGFLTFSNDDAKGDGSEEQHTHDNLILFASTGQNGTFNQVPKREGGLIIPVWRCTGSVGGRKIYTIPGGKHQTIVDWKEDMTYVMVSKKAETIFETNPDVSSVYMDVHAYDRDYESDGGPKPSENDHVVYDVMTADDGKGITGVQVPPPPPSEEGNIFESSNFGRTDFSSSGGSSIVSSFLMRKTGCSWTLSSLVAAFSAVIILTVSW